ncbi:MAG: hypothetical protein D6800_12810, partial [Candidatus Zixiibacteriota bacterium]
AWPQSGYPRLVLDWDGNGVIDHPNDGYYPMSLSVPDTDVTDGADYSVFLTLPPGGNPKIRFEATSSLGQSAVYPASGWLPGPTIIDANASDLYIYADDITYSTFPDIPDAGEPVVIAVEVNNNSPTPYPSVPVNLYFNGQLARIFSVDLPARDANDNPGTAVVTMDTSFSQTCLVQISATVDPGGSIPEWDEDNNSARILMPIKGCLVTPQLLATAGWLGSYYPNVQVSSSGSGWYAVDGDSLNPAAGATAYVILQETGDTLTTSQLDNNGMFLYSFTTPLTTGPYNLQIIVTDGVLADTVVRPFEVVPTNQLNLTIDFALTPYYTTTCSSDPVLVSNPMVYNNGTLPSDTCVAIVLHDSGDTLLIDTVPPLQAGENYPLSSSSIPVLDTQKGWHHITAKVDADNRLPESNENDNIRYRDYRAWCCGNDLAPGTITLGGIPFDSIPISVAVAVCNNGGLTASNFDLLVEAVSGTTTDTVALFTGQTLNPFGFCHTYDVPAYQFADSGWYQMVARVISHGSEGDCDTSNNVLLQSVHVESRSSKKPDLVMQPQWIDPSDLNPGLGDTVCVNNADVYNIGEATAYNVVVEYSYPSLGWVAVDTVDSIPFYGANNYSPSHPQACLVVDSCYQDSVALQVCVDPGNQLPELDENNNCASRNLKFCRCVDSDGDTFGDPGHPENDCPVDNCPYTYN